MATFLFPARWDGAKLAVERCRRVRRTPPRTRQKEGWLPCPRLWMGEVSSRYTRLGHELCAGDGRQCKRAALFAILKGRPRGMEDFQIQGDRVKPRSRLRRASSPFTIKLFCGSRPQRIRYAPVGIVNTRVAFCPGPTGQGQIGSCLCARRSMKRR